MEQEVREETEEKKRRGREDDNAQEISANDSYAYRTKCGDKQTKRALRSQVGSENVSDKTFVKLKHVALPFSTKETSIVMPNEQTN